MAVKTIILRGAGIDKEAIIAEAITPGQLVQLDSAGELIKHATANVYAAPAFARENEVVGDDIDTDYAIDDTGLYTVLPPGAEVFGFLATGNNVAIGDLLVSAGTGALDLQGVGTERVITEALEALNNTSGSDSRLKMSVV